MQAMPSRQTERITNCVSRVLGRVDNEPILLPLLSMLSRKCSIMLRAIRDFFGQRKGEVVAPLQGLSRRPS